MGASSESILVLDLASIEPRQLFEEIVKDLARCQPGWKVKAMGSEVLEFHVPMNMRSWGEVVRITMEYSSVQIESRCSTIFQILDWGKNRRNVEGARSSVKRAAAAAAHPPA